MLTLLASAQDDDDGCGCLHLLKRRGVNRAKEPPADGKPDEQKDAVAENNADSTDGTAPSDAKTDESTLVAEEGTISPDGDRTDQPPAAETDSPGEDGRQDDEHSTQDGREHSSVGDPSISLDSDYSSMANFSEHPELISLNGMQERYNAVGLLNVSHTSYLNAVMQNIYQTYILKDLLKKSPARTGKTLTRQLMKFYKAMWQRSPQRNRTWRDKLKFRSDNNKLDAHVIFSKLCERFKGEHCEDSHQLLRHLLEQLRLEENDLKQKHKRVALKQKVASPVDKTLTTVERVFGGHFLTMFNCQRCQMATHRFYPFLDVSIPMLYDRQPTDEIEHFSLEHHSTVATSPTAPLQEVIEEQPEPSTASQRNSLTGDSAAATKIPESVDKPPEEENAHENETAQEKKEVDDLAHEDDNNQSESVTCEDYLETVEHAKKRLADLERRSVNGESLEDLLLLFTTRERVDNCLCLECNRGDTDVLSSGWRQSLIYNPPAILVIHLRRFQLTTQGYLKDSRRITFDEQLDLSPFCSVYAQRQQGHVLYNLYGIVVHHGSLHAGHYTAYVHVRSSDIERTRAFLQETFLDTDALEDHRRFVEQMKSASPAAPAAESDDPGKSNGGGWWYVSDCDVRSVGVEEVLVQEAYLLFYERSA